MKFLCVDCDTQMASVETAVPDDGTMAITFRCPKCQRQVAMLTNPMETRMVDSLCVDLGERATEKGRRPFESLRSRLDTGIDGGPEPGAADEADEEPTWSDEAERRLGRVPGFVRGMVRRLYVDWARERGLSEITLNVMDEARADLGIEEL